MLLSPIPHPLRATVRVPGSKSLTNRALIIAALANGETKLTNALFSDDSLRCVESLQRLGFDITQSPIPNLQSPITNYQLQITGLGGHIPASKAELFVGNAGTAARFLTAMLTLGHGEYTVDGDVRMRERPIGDLVDALTQLGANVQPSAISLPLKIIASGLRGGSAVISGEVSSQFLSGLLIAAPYAQSPVEIILKSELNSKPYVDMTIAVMKDFGVEVEREEYARFLIAPQKYKAQSNYVIESDASAASYFFAAPAILGGTVRVENVSRQSKQGDIAFLDVLQKMGCEVKEENNSITVGASGRSPLHAVTHPPEGSKTFGRVNGVEVDMRDIPDTAQTLAAIAPFANSPTTIRGIASARVKETDRVAAMCNELRRIGVTVEEYDDGLKIYPCDTIRPAVIQTYNDHRMAMAFALIGLRVEGIEIENPSCVSKTFPNYFEVLGTLRD
ncbi:MAG: 3-phosphoshikimate 1-carboxyvinyltransferase [Chloroflexi bacterium]|nr:3-phosphoshikimate 1-carboxyvinyltransferase [Chloroflexota bacterium]